MKKKTLLCIFDCYPNDEFKLGTFYQSQVGLLKNYFDIQLIILNGKSVSLISWTKNKIEFESVYVDGVSEVDVHNFYIKNPFHDSILRNLIKLNRKILKTHVEFVSKSIIKYHTKNFKTKPDLIYIQTAQYIVPFARYIKKHFDIPLIACEHYPLNVQMTHLWEVNNLDFKNLVKSASKSIDNFMSVSNFLATNLYIYGLSNKFNIVGNYIKEYQVNYAKNKDKEFKVLFIGYSHYVKDPDTFFKAVKILNKMDESIKYLVLSTFDDFHKLLSKYNLQNVVEVRTSVPHSEVIRIMHEEVSVFVSTSLAENWPVSTAEAIVSGLPVITTFNGGNMEYINEKNVILIERASPDQVVDSILKIKQGNYSFNAEKNKKELLKNYGKEAFTKTLLTNLNSVFIDK